MSPSLSFLWPEPAGGNAPVPASEDAPAREWQLTGEGNAATNPTRNHG